MTTFKGQFFRFCPYCRSRGRKDDDIESWQTRSVITGMATRWTRCCVCRAMWREVYNWEKHVYEYAEHWKPAN